MQFKRILSLTMVFVLSLAAFRAVRKATEMNTANLFPMLRQAAETTQIIKKTARAIIKPTTQAPAPQAAVKQTAAAAKRLTVQPPLKTVKQIQAAERLYTIRFGQSLKRAAATVKTHIGRRKQNLRRSIISNSSMFQATTIIFMIRLLRVLLPASLPAILCPQSKLRFPQ